MPPRKPLICIPICASTESQFVAAISAATSKGDLIEFRLDCLDDDAFTDVRAHLPELIALANRPVIVTYRSVDQGGYANDRQKRLQFWLLDDYSSAAFYDIELELIPDLAEASHIDWERVICSHHDFEGIPADLEQLVHNLLNSRARIAKLVVRVDDAIDCLPVFDLLDHATKAERELIGFGMGQVGIMTRVLGPSRGSFLTYATAYKGSETAPGQLTADELREVYRIKRISDQTSIMGIIGKPVAQSFSPRIHNAAFDTTGLDAVFIPIEVGNLSAFIDRMANPRTRELDWNLRGLSVTAPHKRAVMDHLDFIDPIAKQIGAVNTIVVNDDELWGYNTDVLGFVSSLKQRVDNLQGKRAAVLGAGGAARAVLSGLISESATAVVFARDTNKGELLASEFASDSHSLADAAFGDFDLVINATSLGMAGKTERETPATTAQLRGARFAYDLVYNPSETRFLAEAKNAGCETIGGLAMLVAQATAQFKLWTGVEAPEAAMKKAAEKAIQES